MWFLYLIVSISSAFGISIALVKKGDDWPVNFYVKILKIVLRVFHHKLPAMFDCVVCTSFWATLITDIILYITCGYFAWPLSGFITVGLSWFLLDVSDSLYKIGSKNEE